jgi:hypothetical protein
MFFMDFIYGYDVRRSLSDMRGSKMEVMHLVNAAPLRSD